MGHRSRTAGSAFEGRIENALESAKQQRIVAWFAHQQPLMTRSGQPIAQSGADYVGLLVGSAAMLAIECKSAAQRQNTAKIERNEFTVQQQAHLAAVAENGGLALAALEFRDDKTGLYRSFMLPWSLVPWTRARIHQSIHADELDVRWSIPAMNAIAMHVEKCGHCNSWMPLFGGSKRCCFPPAPF